MTNISENVPTLLLLLAVTVVNIWDEDYRDWVSIGAVNLQDLLDVNKIAKNENIIISIHSTTRPSVITAAASYTSSAR